MEWIMGATTTSVREPFRVASMQLVPQSHASCHQTEKLQLWPCLKSAPFHFQRYDGLQGLRAIWKAPHEMSFWVLPWIDHWKMIRIEFRICRDSETQCHRTGSRHSLNWSASNGSLLTPASFSSLLSSSIRVMQERSMHKHVLHQIIHVFHYIFHRHHIAKRTFYVYSWA